MKALTPEEAWDEVRAADTGETLALAVGWLVGVSAVMNKYGESPWAVPEVLRDFLVDVEQAADDWLGE